MYIIVGLGNPGIQYVNTRHNIGFDAIDALAYKYDIKINNMKFKAESGQGIIEGKKVLLVKPQTFMNNSGEAVRDVIKFYKGDPEKDLLVIFDDISLDPGSIRIRPKGSAGGHNGIKSIIANLGSENFARIKIGVGSKIPGQDLANHVLGRFNDSDRLKVDDAVMKAVEATSVILTEGISKAQNLFN